MLIYLCLSSHGYGHAVRQSALIKELYKLRPNWTFVVSSVVKRDFLDLIFTGIPIIYRDFEWDVGTIQKSSLDIDKSSTLEKLKGISSSLPEAIKREADWVKERYEKVLIISDIPPFAAYLSYLIEAPLIWTGNFGWDDIYADYGDQFKFFCLEFKKLYSSGDLLIRFPFSLDMNWGIREFSVGLVASKPVDLDPLTKTRIKTIKQPIVIICFGGFDLQFDPKLYSKWPEYNFAVPAIVNNKKFHDSKIENLIHIPNNLRIVDFMPYASNIICKPGFSTFCEAITNDLTLNVVHRNEFAEANSLIDGIKDLGASSFMTKEEFLMGDWKLDSEKYIQPIKSIDSDGAHQSATIIIEFCANYY